MQDIWKSTHCSLQSEPAPVVFFKNFGMNYIVSQDTKHDLSAWVKLCLSRKLKSSSEKSKLPLGLRGRQGRRSGVVWRGFCSTKRAGAAAALNEMFLLDTAVLSCPRQHRLCPEQDGSLSGASAKRKLCFWHCLVQATPSYLCRFPDCFLGLCATSMFSLSQGGVHVWKLFAKRSGESCGEDKVEKTREIRREYTANMAAGSWPALAAVLNINSASLHAVEE